MSVLSTHHSSRESTLVNATTLEPRPIALGLSRGDSDREED